MTKHKDRRVALYLRVSTSEQTTKDQRRELEAVAERHGWLVVSAFHCARQQDGARRLGAAGQGRHLSSACARGSVRRGCPMGG